MELSFSSEKEEYDDFVLNTNRRDETDADPPARPTQSAVQMSSSHATTRAHPLPPARPAMGWGASGTGGGNMADSSTINNIVRPVPASAATTASHTSLWGARRASGEGSGTSVAASTILTPLAASGGDGEVQPFDPSAVEGSVSRRRRSTSMSHSKSRGEQRRERKEKAALALARRRQATEEAAPGAIEDASSPRFHNKDKNKSNHSTLFPSSNLKIQDGIVVGSTKSGGGGGSMIADMARKGGRGAFSVGKDLQFSSDEEEEPGPTLKNATGKHKGKNNGNGDGSKDNARPNAAAASTGDRDAAARTSDVAPLINDVAFDFAWRRALTTALGGMRTTWTTLPTDERMPALPGRFIVAQVCLLLYPACIGIALNAVADNTGLDIGVAAAIAGAAGALVHLFIHLIHRRILHSDRRGGRHPSHSSSSTRVADSSSVTPSGSKLPMETRTDEQWEHELQRLVKAEAIHNGTLPAKKKQKDKAQQQEEEDDPSLPPDVAPRKKIVIDDDSDDDADAMERGGKTDGSNAPSSSSNASGSGSGSVFSPAGCAWILGARPRATWNVLLSAICVGVVLCGATYLLDWRWLRLTIGPFSPFTSEVDGIIFGAFAWISFSLCIYSMNVRTTPEPNMWDPSIADAEGSWHGWLVIQAQRTIYLALTGGYAVAYRREMDAFFDVATMSLPEAAQIAHVISLVLLALLPALFFVAALPPPDALLLWSMEQVQLLFVGVGPSATSRRQFFSFVVHSLAALIAFFVWAFLGHSTAFVVCIALGLGCGWVSLVGLSSASKSSTTTQSGGDIPQTDPEHHPYNHSQTKLAEKTMLVFCIMLVGIIICSPVIDIVSWNLLEEIQVLHDADLAFDEVVLVLTLLIGLWQHLHRPWLFGGLVRNRLYKLLVVDSESILSSDHEEASRVQRRRGITSGILRAFLLVYVCFHQQPDRFVQAPDGSTVWDQLGHTSRLHLFVSAVLMFRTLNAVLRWPLMDGFASTLVVLIIDGLDHLATGGASSSWSSLDWNVRFCIGGFVFLRLRNDLLPKIWFWTTLTYTSFAYPKLRMRHPERMKIICILLIPYHLAIIMLASALGGCHLLPLLGSPIFVLSFPRPLRLWCEIGGKFGMNESSQSRQNGGSDIMFYQHMLPSLYASLRKSFKGGILGSLGSEVRPGEVLVIRAEPYMLWVQILEVGQGGIWLQVKGLELSMTSCHTVEALRMDENIEAIMDGIDSSDSSQPNPPLGPLYTYEPLMKMSNQIESWDITRNVLTGIIDDPTNLSLLSTTFLKALIRNSWRMMVERAKVAGIRDTTVSLDMLLPAHWLRPSVNAFDLQQLEDAKLWPEGYVNWLMNGATSGTGTMSLKLSAKDLGLFRRIILSIYALVEALGTGSSGAIPSFNGSNNSSTGPKIRNTPAHVLGVFEGRIGRSLYSDWLFDAAGGDMVSLVVSSYRQSVKTLYDCASLAMLETLEAGAGSTEEDRDAYEELHTMWKEYEEEWYIGPVETEDNEKKQSALSSQKGATSSSSASSSSEWSRVLRAGGRKLFSISRSPESRNKFTSLTLAQGTLPAVLLSTSGTAIRSFGSSLSLELLYFANDDDERYSIQAHPQLLRNLTVQASEPPLGYPVFSPLPTLIRTE